jgi:hypothetical protein
LAGRSGGRATADFGQRRQKTGKKIYILKSMSFPQENFLLLAISFNNIAESDFNGQPVFMFIVSFMA